MAAKKREIYARAAVQLRTHERAIRAETTCPGAMGLYFFLLLDARGEQSAGDVDELVAICSWGAPRSYRKRQAEALLAVGLIERRADRLHVVRYAEHNDTPEDIESAKEAARNRQRTRRGHGEVTRDMSVSHADVPISISSSLSESGSQEGVQGEAGVTTGVHVVRRSEPSPSKPPDWWAGAIASAEQAVGGDPIDQREARWLEYDASRDRKGWARNHRDAVGWLTTVVRTERRNARASPPKRDAEITKQPFDPDAPWMKVTA